jgi:uncharacterized membrane protein
MRWDIALLSVLVLLATTALLWLTDRWLKRRGWDWGEAIMVIFLGTLGIAAIASILALIYAVLDKAIPKG